ncbi:MAG TPA: hypothetical protein VHM92_00230 [Allosphingosinicella sp.]|nr:hypothetical protein [Allosphingosinicella sp.]
MKRHSRLLLCAAALAGLAAGGAEAAPLVVRSAGPSAKSFPPGRVLPDKAPVALKAGDMVTVLLPGGSRVLRGPGTFTVGGGASAASFNPRGRFGAMRAGEVPMSPSLWDVDVSQSGRVCLADLKAVTLWRPEKDEAVTVTIAGPGAAERKVEWAGGKDILAWPAAVPIDEGTEYRVSWTGNDDPTKLSFVALPTVPEDRPGLAKALIDRQCQSQFDLLIDTSPSAEP